MMFNFLSVAVQVEAGLFSTTFNIPRKTTIPADKTEHKVSGKWLLPPHYTHIILLYMYINACIYMYMFLNDMYMYNEVQNQWRNKCSTIVEKNCVVAEYHLLYRTVSGYVP